MSSSLWFGSWSLVRRVFSVLKVWSSFLHSCFKFLYPDCSSTALAFWASSGSAIVIMSFTVPCLTKFVHFFFFFFSPQRLKMSELCLCFGSSATGRGEGGVLFPSSKKFKVLLKCCRLLQWKANQTYKQGIMPSSQQRLWERLTEVGWGAVKIVKTDRQSTSAWKGRHKNTAAF